MCVRRYIKFSHFVNITFIFHRNQKHMMVGHLMFELHAKFFLKTFHLSKKCDFAKKVRNPNLKYNVAKFL